MKSKPLPKNRDAERRSVAKTPHTNERKKERELNQTSPSNAF